MRTDVVVVGAGAGGIATALALADAGRSCIVITAGALGSGASCMAQGGMAAAIGRADAASSHIADTLAAGAGLCDPAAVAALVDEAPLAILRLLALGARFDIDADGLDLGLEGGHGARRIVHAGGATGAEVMGVLVRSLRTAETEGRILVLEHATVRAVRTDAHGAACGVLVDGDEGMEPIDARAVVLATGGAGALWSATTNPMSATGTGIALALRAGATVRDLELQQWHPTALAVPTTGSLPLISEAVRGEGAAIVDARGREVVDPLATRDVVAAAMAARIAASGADHLLLDARGLGATGWSRFEAILHVLHAHGIDPLTEHIPVRPAAHSTCGGIVASLDGTTSVHGLLVVGEAASTGVHGANRLASNGLTEALVAGTRAGLALAAALPAPGPASPVESASTGATTRMKTASRESASLEAASLDAASLESASLETAPLASRSRMARAMTRHAGPLRDATGLTRLETLLGAEPESDARLLSLLVARSAELRRESRGVHRRLDHPDLRAEWSRHIDWRLVDGEPVASLGPVLASEPIALPMEHAA